MAFDDYWINAKRVSKSLVNDGTGGFEYAYEVSRKNLKCGIFKAGTNQQIVGAVRNDVDEIYNIATYDNNKLLKDDIIVFEDEDRNRVFLRVNSNMTRTPNKSGQSHWKYGTATLFEPDLRVVN